MSFPGFVITPTSVNATLGFTTTFHCSTTTGMVTWLVNGSSALNRPDITINNGGGMLHLHVPATEEYNNTNVTCVVFFFVGMESEHLFSAPAVLRVQGMFGM